MTLVLIFFGMLCMGESFVLFEEIFKTFTSSLQNSSLWSLHSRLNSPSKPSILKVFCGFLNKKLHCQLWPTPKVLGGGAPTTCPPLTFPGAFVCLITRRQTRRPTKTDPHLAQPRCEAVRRPLPNTLASGSTVQELPFVPDAPQLFIPGFKTGVWNIWFCWTDFFLFVCPTPGLGWNFHLKVSAESSIESFDLQFTVP